MPEKLGLRDSLHFAWRGRRPCFGCCTRFAGERVARADLGRLWLCGLTGVTVNQLLFFNGAATSPVHASIIMTINPVLVLLISAAMLGTAITPRKVAGIALGAAGAITVLLTGGGGGLESHASWQGDLMVLLNAASYGVYLVVVKPLMAKYRPLTVISWVFLFGGLMAFPVGAIQAAAIEWSTLSTQDWVSVGFVCCHNVLGLPSEHLCFGQGAADGGEHLHLPPAPACGWHGLAGGHLRRGGLHGGHGMVTGGLCGGDCRWGLACEFATWRVARSAVIRLPSGHGDTQTVQLDVVD